MNADDGVYRLSHLYDQLIKSISSTCSDIISRPTSSGSAGSEAIPHSNAVFGWQVQNAWLYTKIHSENNLLRILDRKSTSNN